MKVGHKTDILNGIWIQWCPLYTEAEKCQSALTKFKRWNRLDGEAACPIQPPIDKRQDCNLCISSLDSCLIT